MFVLLGLVGSAALMAGTNVFTPVVQFIHSGTITPLQAGVCLVFTMAGFTACYFLLNLLCSYFVPCIVMSSGGSGGTIQIKENGEDVTNRR